MLTIKSFYLIYRSTSQVHTQLLHIIFKLLNKYGTSQWHPNSLIYQTFLILYNEIHKVNGMLSSFYSLISRYSLSLNEREKKNERKQRILIFFLRAKGFSLKLFKIAMRFCSLFKTLATLTKKIRIYFHMNINRVREVCIMNSVNCGLMPLVSLGRYI